MLCRLFESQSSLWLLTVQLCSTMCPLACIHWSLFARKLSYPRSVWCSILADLLIAPGFDGEKVPLVGNRALFIVGQELVIFWKLRSPFSLQLVWMLRNELSTETAERKVQISCVITDTFCFAWCGPGCFVAVRNLGHRIEKLAPSPHGNSCGNIRSIFWTKTGHEKTSVPDQHDSPFVVAIDADLEALQLSNSLVYLSDTIW